MIISPERFPSFNFSLDTSRHLLSTRQVLNQAISVKAFVASGGISSRGQGVRHVGIFVGTKLAFRFGEIGLGMRPGSHHGKDDGLCGFVLGFHTCCRPYTHLQAWKSLQPTWCVLGGTSLSPKPLSPRFGLLLSRLTPREAKGGRPYLTMLSLIK